MISPTRKTWSVGRLLLVALWLAASLALGGCERESPGGITNNQNGGNSNNCPAAPPVDGTGCSDPGVWACSYVVELCPCDTDDLYNRCTCGNGEWYCSREYDCYVRCGDAGGM